MAVLEVEMPTSYEVDGELAKLLTQRDPLLQKVEISESNTKIMLYYDKVTSRESCIELVGYPMYLAENLKNKTMILYDYYEPSESTAVNYRTSRSVDMKELLADEAQPISASLGAVESFSLRQTSSCVFLVIFSVLSSFSFR